MGALCCVAAALAATSAQAQQQRGPLVLKNVELFLCRRQDRHDGEGQPDRRPHVCRVHDPAAPASSLSDRDGAWRQPDRHQLHRHARRPRRLGAVFRAPRLRGLHRRSGRTRPLRALVAGVWRGAAVATSSQVDERFVAPERYPLWPQAKLHTQWPGDGKPGDVGFEQFYCCAGGLVRSFAKQQEINPPAIIALLEKIGPSILMIHSQSGAFAWPIADKRPDLVKMIVAVEPNGPPVRESRWSARPIGSRTSTSRQALRTRRGPAQLRAAARGRAAKLEFVRQEKADGPELVRCWLQKEPARKLQEPRQRPGRRPHDARRPTTRPTITAPSPTCGRPACETTSSGLPTSAFAATAT